VAIADFILVDVAGFEVGDEQLPDAAAAALKSPTTLTRSALGAQTANSTPPTPSA